MSASRRNLLFFCGVILALGGFLLWRGHFANPCQEKHFSQWQKRLTESLGQDEAILQQGIFYWKKCPDWNSRFFTLLGMNPEEALSQLRERKLAEIKAKETLALGEKATASSLAALGKQLRDQIEQGLYVESELLSYLYAVNISRPHLPTLQSDPFKQYWQGRLRGSIALKKGILLRSSGTPNASGEDWIWTFEKVYRRTTNDRWIGETPPREIIREYETALLKWNPTLAREFNNRAHRFYQKGEYARAREVIQYALKLDPEYNLAWYNAAAYAALEGNVQKTLEFLLHVKFPPKTLLEKIRQDADFKTLLQQNRVFREFVFRDIFKTAQSSDFLKSFEVVLDDSRSIPCDWEKDSCESIKEFHEDLLLHRRDQPNGWRIVLKQDYTSPKGEEKSIFLPMQDVGNRLFLIFEGQAYEAPMAESTLNKISEAVSFIQSNSQFPLYLVQKLSTDNKQTEMKIASYSGLPGETTKEVGCFTTPVSMQMDDYWTIEYRVKQFFAVDPAQGISQALIKTNCSF